MVINFPWLSNRVIEKKKKKEEDKEKEKVSRPLNRLKTLNSYPTRRKLFKHWAC